jgi:hypothetical protein
MREDGLLYMKSALLPSKEFALRNALHVHTHTY